MFVCDRGCLTDGKPTRHANEGACPVIRAERKAAKTQNVPERRTEPRDAAPTPEAPKPAAPPPEKGAWEKFVEFVREPAKTVASPEVPEKQQAYLLEGEDVVNFWQIVLSLFEFALNLVLRIFGAPMLPDDLMDVKKSKASSLLISRNMRHTTSQLFISIGVSTKGEAQALIGEGEGILAFGHIAAGVAWHFINELPKSPGWKKWIDRAPGAQGPNLLTPTPNASGGAWWDPLGWFNKAPADATKATTPPILSAPA